MLPYIPKYVISGLKGPFKPQ